MNLPNKLTLLRVVLIPVFVVFALTPSIPHNYLWAVVVFAAASATDALDGMIARKYDLITNFGKLMDPLADKVLVLSALICFVQLGMVRGWVVIVIISRELLVTSIRLIAAGEGKIIAADRWGKYKTVSQMVSVIAILLLSELEQSRLLSPTFPKGTVIWALMIIVLILTVFSGVNYAVGAKDVFSDAG